ncbi:OmpA family protein [Shewanella sp. Choline-02u-19]|uniref:OmpA family protein n=1 Tax=unclassified Shewanella TaxID=196818 RepID=UPI000C336DA8|nr:MULTISPECIES: OmpA family protein [unclassified Shewanella]PKH54904.1 OmpA family protein [Shewanella sp. Bg11-22]PKI26676.1 OmpA family protein [Shewanella sp. Choline-02u-19]
MLTILKRCSHCLLTLFVSVALFVSSFAAASEDRSVHSSVENNPSLKTELSPAYFYLGAELGVNYYQHGCESWSLDCDRNSNAAGFFAGYQINNHFAFEAAYLDLGEANATYLEGGIAQKYQGTMQGLNLSVLGSIELNEDLSIFAKVGAFNWHGENSGPFSTVSENDWAPSLGAGMSYQLTDSWQARFEYQYFHQLGNDILGGTNAHVTAIGISYQFGRTRAAPMTESPVTEISINETKVTAAVVATPPIVLEQITFPYLFDFDSSELHSSEPLQVIVERLTRYSQAQVILRGYSDSRGSSAYNLALSKRRTTSVYQYLIAQGVNDKQIVSEYFGDQNPVTDNLTEEHRHLNRHVQILLPQLTLPEVMPQQEQ